MRQQDKLRLDLGAHGSVGVCDGDQIRRAAGECLKRVPLTQKIRLLGVRAGALLPVASLVASGIQAELPF